MDLERDDQLQEQEENAQETAVGQPDEQKYALVVSNKAQGIETEYSLAEGTEIIVGADPECNVYVDDEFISSRHFSLRIEKGDIEAKDFGSKNGLYLRIDKPQNVLSGQVLLAGKTTFRIREESNA